MADAQDGNSPVALTRDSAEKIQEAVRRVMNDFPTHKNTPYQVRAAPYFEFYAKITDSELFSGGYKYAWIEQRRTNTGWEDLPGGRVGSLACSDPDMVTPSTVCRYALNQGEQGAAMELSWVDDDSIVLMRLTFADTGKPYYSFYYSEPLTVGTYCNHVPHYDDHSDIDKVSFDVDQFFVARDTHTGQSARVQISWNGFTTVHTTAAESSGSGPSDKFCFNEILDWVDANQGSGDGPGTPKPTGTTKQTPTGAGLWEFGIYWGISNNRETDFPDCATCEFRETKGATQIAGSIVIDPCKFLPIIEDCTGTSPGTYNCIQTLKFNNGLKVTSASGTSGSPGTATIDVDLTVGTGGSYLGIAAAGSGCGMVINLCTRTVNPVATTVVTGCDDSGNPTTATVYGLPNDTPLIVLDDCGS